MKVQKRFCYCDVITSHDSICDIAFCFYFAAEDETMRCVPLVWNEEIKYVKSRRRER